MSASRLCVSVYRQGGESQPPQPPSPLIVGMRPGLSLINPFWDEGACLLFHQEVWGRARPSGGVGA
eukprot:1343308-Pyramimonas_sp.AAC.1